MEYREIKFKAQIYGSNEWIEGNLIHQTDNYGDIVDWYFIVDGSETYDYDIGDPVRVIPATICQFTGLYDRHGKPIYENDKIYDHETNCYGEIIWFEEQAAFCVFEDENITYSFDVVQERVELEVVGNIFDDNSEK